MIYDKVMDFCKAKNITVSEFEQEHKFGNGTVGKWKTFNPRMETLKKLAKAMETSVDELLEE